MTQIRKNQFALLIVTLLVFMFSFSGFAQENKQANKVYTEDLGNGISATVTLSEVNTMTRSAKTYSIAKEYYKDGSYIGNAVLYASFSYNGSTAEATAASGAGTGAGGWNYGGQSTWISGSSAYLSASLSKGGTTVPVNLSLHCDAYGNIS